MSNFPEVEAQLVKRGWTWDGDKFLDSPCGTDWWFWRDGETNDGTKIQTVDELYEYLENFGNEGVAQVHGSVESHCPTCGKRFDE